MESVSYTHLELEMNNPDHIALKYYRSYHSGSAKTLKSIQITLAARLEKFNLEDVYKRQLYYTAIFAVQHACEKWVAAL